MDGQIAGGKRVLITLPCWYLSGVPAVHCQIANGLARRGWAVTVVVPEGTGLPLKLDSRVCSVSLFNAERWLGWLPATRRKFMITNRVHDYQWPALLRRIQPTYWIAGPSGFALSRSRALASATRRIQILHADDEDNRRSVTESQLPWHGLVTVSEHLLPVAWQLVDSAATAVVAICNGVAVSAKSRRTTGANDKPLTLVYAGRLEQQQKRTLDLIPLCKQLEALGIDYRLHIAGEGTIRPQLESELASEVMYGRVTFHGRLGFAALRDLYRMGDVILNLSEFEGTPMAVLEAMAEGCVPVVSRGSGGIVPHIRTGTNGFAFDVGDLPTAISALRSLACDRVLLRRLADSAHRTIVDGPFSAERMVDSYHQFLCQLPQ
jgi:glycosyltransferase involved in cell wall biosynthesis